MRVFLRTLYCTLNLVIVLALIGCLLTQYINPITFPYFELLALGFPIIVVLNIIASICWIAAADHKRRQSSRRAQVTDSCVRYTDPSQQQATANPRPRTSY